MKILSREINYLHIIFNIIINSSTNLKILVTKYHKNMVK